MLLEQAEHPPPSRPDGCPASGQALVFVADQGEDRQVSYPDLLTEAARRGAGLRRLGLKPGDRVLIMLPTSPDYFYTMFGTWLAGGIPVPLAPPFRPSQLEKHVHHLGAVIADCQARFFITVPQASTMVRLAGARHGKAPQVLDTEAFTDQSGAFTPHKPKAGDTAFIQYTSGSTADPRGVELSHEQILANLYAIGHALQYKPGDAAVSWLPLFHDMGLFGTLSCVYWGIPMVLIPPERYMQNPALWLQALSKYRGCISPAPNFGYSLALRRVRDRDLEGCDLSSWRAAMCGAEPVNPATMRAFAERFAPFKLQPEAMLPVYGLAEATLAATFPPLLRGLRVDSIDREVFQAQGKATPIAESADALVFPSVGVPLAGLEVRVVDGKGKPVPERTVGDIVIRGASVMKGYFRKTSREVLRDGWLQTGDLGYMADGEFYITGRRKDLIIRGGRNIVPQDVEAAVESVTGIRTGCSAAFAHGDGMVVACETRWAKDKHAALKQAIRHACQERVGTAPDHIALLPPGSVPKTTSGKVQRALTGKQYGDGSLGRRKPLWLQIASIGLGAAGLLASRLLWKAFRRAKTAPPAAPEAEVEPHPEEREPAHVG
jgi:acyl-CoA synthetase (AMP-forming)/AMP-acid ligase II